jgi:hypothetical protein
LKGSIFDERRVQIQVFLHADDRNVGLTGRGPFVRIASHCALSEKFSCVPARFRRAAEGHRRRSVGP